MSLETQAPVEAFDGERPVMPVEVTLPKDDKISSIREAARALSAWRTEKRKQLEQEAGAEQPATPEPVSAPEADIAPVETQPSDETAENAEPDNLPPIDAPVSWTAEEKARFAQLPRETQEYISNRERARDAEIRRSQNEYADKLKQHQQEQEALAQARAQYEQALPALLQSLQSTGEFADIRSMEDVEKLAREDWPRYVQWDAHNKKVQAVHQEMLAAQQRQMQEQSAQWQQYAAEQDRLFAERVPEFADPEKAKPLRELTVKVLQKDYGFSPEEMQQAWNGPFRDARVQQILLDAAQWRNLKANPPKPVAKDVPPVQRPGAVRNATPALDAEIKALEQKLETTSGINALRIATQLTGLRRQAAAKRR
jgi:predicted house-cleaning noncanonical NTP pyrophosphatase (MazG superfamily)